MTRDAALPSETLAALLRTALQAYKRGEQGSARSLVRALTIRQPDDPRVWLTLAKIAETREEQRHALERVVALDPTHPLAQQSLDRFRSLHANTAAAAPQPAPAVAPDPAPVAAGAPVAAQDEDAYAGESAPRWPLYAVILAAVVVVALAYMLLRSGSGSQATATPALPDAVLGEAGNATPSLLAGANATAPASAGGAPTAAAPLIIATAPLSDAVGALPGVSTVPVTATALPVAGAGISATEAISGAVTAAPQTVLPTLPTLPPVATAAAQAAPGQLVTAGPWTATLLQPSYAVTLDGSIGPLQPQGRFVLALMSVANTGTAAASVPETLFTLVDDRGNGYQSSAAASASYLDAYGRGQRGDFSTQDPIPGGGRTWSVPIIFDVPASAQGLSVRVAGATSGWPVSQPAPTPTS